MPDPRASNLGGLTLRGALCTALVLVGLCGALAGCTGPGAAVSVRWRISEVGTGEFYDPRDVSDSVGTCCKDSDTLCASQSNAWRVTRVQLALIDQATEVPLANAPNGLDAPCSARELTTPFELPPGTYAISLRAYDPAVPDVVEAESPSPEIRTLRRAEIVNLDVVVLSVVP